MKKMISVLMIVILGLSTGMNAEAKVDGKITHTPNIMDAKTFKQMRAGTYNNKGIKLGVTDKAVIKRMGKQYDYTTNFYVKGDKVISYEDAVIEGLSTYYFVKKNGQYRLRGYNVMLTKNEPTLQTIVKRYGKPNDKKINGSYALYTYQQVQITFVKEHKKWHVLGYQYATKKDIKISQKEFEGYKY